MEKKVQITLSDYLAAIEEDKREILQKLITIFDKSLSEGFSRTIQNNMINYVVSLSRYPKGYLNDGKTPLPFISLAAQKHHIAIYHMAIYAEPELKEWFKEQYEIQTDLKLDMGKSCIRFKKFEKIPYELIAELAGKISVQDYISIIKKHSL
jgi:hypothetical protein